MGRFQGRLRGLLLLPAVALLAGCNDNQAPAAADPAATQLVKVERYNPETGVLLGGTRASYPAAGRVVLQSFGATGEAGSSRQECEFGEAGSPYLAVTSRVVDGLDFGSPTGQILQSLLGLPEGWTSCQAFFPERLLLAEHRISRPPEADEDLRVDDIIITRPAEGVLVQSHVSGLLELIYPPVSSFTEAVRYVRAEGRITGMIYGAEAWPEDGSYIDFSGNAVYDIFLFGLLTGLLETTDGAIVSPAAGYALRYGYDSQGRLESLRTYDDWGADEQWLTDDDVAAVGGLARFRHEGSALVQVETGLDPVDGQPTAAYRNELYRRVDGWPQEKRVQDALGRLVERWQYAHR